MEEAIVETVGKPGWLRSAREIYGWSIETADGEAGRVHDVYFDDVCWTIRHLVVEIGHRLGGRRVLLPPGVIRSADPTGRALRTDLSRRQVSQSPTTDVAKPVSRQHEMELARYYRFPSYAVSVAAGVALAPSLLDRSPERVDPHLRSVRAITGYYVHARDGDVGHAADFLIADASWALRQLVVSVGTWWPVRKVLVPVGWIAEVSWGASAVEISLPSEPVRLAPEYDPAVGVSAEYLARLDRYYGPAPFVSG